MGYSLKYFTLLNIHLLKKKEKMTLFFYTIAFIFICVCYSLPFGNYFYLELDHHNNSTLEFMGFDYHDSIPKNEYSNVAQFLIEYNQLKPGMYHVNGNDFSVNIIRLF